MTPRTDRDRRQYLAPRQRVSTVIHLTIAWSFGFMLMAVVVLQEAVPAETLILDRNAVSGGRWYTGMITSIGILAWTVAAAGCVTAAYVARLDGRAAAFRAFGLGALVISFLTLDDLFLLHSNVAPKFLGVPKLAVVALEGIAVLLWVAASRAELARTRWELLVATAGAFAVSNAMDVVALIEDDRWRLIIEDGAKFFGVLSLAAWGVSSAADIVRSVVLRSQTFLATPPSTPVNMRERRDGAPVGPPSGRGRRAPVATGDRDQT